MKTKLVLTLMVLLWMLVIGAGLHTMFRYQSTAVEPGALSAFQSGKGRLRHENDGAPLSLNPPGEKTNTAVFGRSLWENTGQRVAMGADHGRC